jgi:sulfite reductase (NADPH) flavoprotein alpha-component
MICIAFGSQTGNAQNLAQVIGGQLENEGFLTNVIDMSSLDPENLSDLDTLIIVTSTYGDGEAPDNASEWLSYLKFADDVQLGNLKFAVLGLGDTYYPHFCQCAKDFDYYLSKHGGHQLLPRLDCDLYYEEQYADWLTNLIKVLKKVLPE